MTMQRLMSDGRPTARHMAWLLLFLSGCGKTTMDNPPNSVARSDWESPAIRLVQTKAPQRSRIGGEPCLASGTEWPRWQGRPLSLIAQIALEELPAGASSEFDLPEKGTLQFFFDAVEQPWGYDPEHAGGARVVYTSAQPETPTPFPDDLPSTARFKPMFVTFERFSSLADPDFLHTLSVDLDSGPGKERFDRWFEELKGIRSQMCGFPLSIQGDMRQQCALVTNGIYQGDSEWLDDPRAQQFLGEASEWTLLLQIDSHHEETGMMWGDVGRLYYWIKRSDLKARNFDNAWMILQCY